MQAQTLSKFITQKLSAKSVAVVYNDSPYGVAEGMYLSSFAPSPKTIASAAWIEAYQAVESRNPDTYSVNGYVAMNVLLDAARQAGSQDYQKISAALRADTFHTLMGDLKYQPTGDVVNAKIYMYQVQNGEFTQVDWGN